MTKILVFSDSHGEVESMVRIIESANPDIVIHLGDYTSDCDQLCRKFPELQITGVRGNCDYRSAVPELRKLYVDGKLIFAAHGHVYNVKSGYTRICYAAMEADADILLFGHTHIAHRDTGLGMEIMNPGSIGRGAHPSYGVIIIDGDNIKTEIVYI